MLANNCYTKDMDEHMPPQDPNDPDATDDDQTDAWEEIGSREPLRPLTHDEVMALGAQGLGGEAVKKRYEDHQFYVDRGIGTNTPALDDDAQAAARKRSLEIRREQVAADRAAAEQLPEGSDKSDELARIRKREEQLNQLEQQ